MNPIKQAFQKVKEDISELKKEIQELKRTLNQTDNQTDRHKTQTQTQTNQTDRQTDIISPHEIAGLKDKNSAVSTRNEGVQTDRQTDNQTDRHILKPEKSTRKVRLTDKTSTIADISKVSEVLNSLDSLKKELRAKFKKLTSQEILIFSTIYQLEEQGFTVDYSLLAQKTHLSQSAIRDYTQSLIKKSIPLDKFKENNKKITLSVSPNLKKIATLDTILQLREI